MLASLTENRLERKRYAVNGPLGHLTGMGAKREKKAKTVLQQVFLKRVQEEMDARGLSRNGLAVRPGGPPQTTFNDVMLGADPRLETISQIAVALGVHPWELLVERDPGVAHERQQDSPTSAKVHRLPSPYSPIFPKKEQQHKITKARKKR